MPKVSFLIVNWNGKDLLAECLNAILEQTCQDFEIVFVDNGSTDGSTDFIREYYPEVILVELENNYGFAGGNNRGLSHCRGEYIALVNNDVILDREWLMNLTAILDLNADVGFCSSRIFIKGTDRIDSVGDRFTSAFTGMKLGEHEKGATYDMPVTVHGVCAAAALYRRTMLDDVGSFDDDLFLNYEDTDLNLRAWLQGWKCLYVPGAQAQHAVNATIGTMSTTSVFYFSRNSLLVLIKNIPWPLILIRLPQRLFYEVCALTYYGIWCRRLVPYLKGKVDALRLLPKMYRKRKDTVGRIKLSFNEILRQQSSIVSHVLNSFRKV